MPGPLDPSLADALASLAGSQTHDQTLAEIEGRADTTGAAIVDRASGSFVALQLRAGSAQRVVELGAGPGDLTWWLTGAVGQDGEVIAVTGTDDADVLERTLRRGGRFDRVDLRAVDHPAPASPDHLGAVDGELDAIVVRTVTPRLVETVEATGARLRAGGLLLVEGVLAEGGPPAGRAGQLARTCLEDPELWTSIVPLGAGWLVALRARSDLAGGATDRLW